MSYCFIRSATCHCLNLAFWFDRSAGEVTIRIKNEGPDAIDPDVYGKTIIITRHFDIQGASGFKIKSSLHAGKNGEGRVVATSKAELQRITDAMNIQVLITPFHGWSLPMRLLTRSHTLRFRWTIL